MSSVENKALNCHSLANTIGEAEFKPQLLARQTAGRAFKLSWLMAALMVGGCASYNKDHITVGSTSSDYRLRHPIIVSDNEVFEDISISASTRRLSLRDRNVARNFAMRFRRSGARTIRIVLPVGSRNERTARRISKQISAEFREVGIRPTQISSSSYQASGHGDAASIRIVYSSMTAAVASECGVWAKDIGYTPENRNYGNFGCATQNNLAMMVANPADLLGPRGESEIDATRRDAVISDWRENGSQELPKLLTN